MASQNQKDALYAWLNTLELSRQVTSAEDLCDGTLLFGVLTDIDPKLFRPLRQPTGEDEASKNWVLRFNHLKRMYKLIVHYFEETLNLSTTTLIQPNLQSIAKDFDEHEVVQLTCVILALAVQSHQNTKHVDKIQSLEEWAQRELMGCIETVMQTVSDKDAELDESSAIDDSRNNDSMDSGHLVEANTSSLSSKLANVQAENETLTSVYDDLLKQHNTLREDYDEALRNLSAAEEKAEIAAASSSSSNNDRTEGSFKAEVDRLRTEWQKAENRADENESQIEKLQTSISDLTRKMGDLHVKAEQADALVDQVDELRHTAEKLQKAENVIEKYKRKLDEGADLRRSIKTLEEQNSNLVDRNSEIEEEYKKVSAFKSLMDSYKKKMDESETKNGELAKELETLKFDVNKKSEEARIIQEEKTKQNEALELYEARVKELELETGGKRTRKSSSKGEDDDDDDQVEDELQDAMEGTTMTDLKIQVRKLKRDLQDAQANKADGSRILVLENLLEDSSRMKSKYEIKYLNEHREKLKLAEQLEQIRSGKSDFSDGPESAIALRKRLAEVTDELDTARTDLNKLTVTHEHTQKELLIAQSDLKLVNKDQVEVLATLRASVSTEKEGLEAQVLQLKEEKAELQQNNSMQLSQINTLLREKVGMQSDSITQREVLLTTERNIAKLKVSLAGKGLSEEDEARITQLTDNLKSLTESNQVLEDKLQQATDIIEQKDQLYREQQAGALLVEETRQGDSARVQQLEEELARFKNHVLEVESHYRKENALMLGAWQEEGLRRAREGIADAAKRASIAPSSWLGRQRSRGAGKVLVR